MLLQQVVHNIEITKQFEQFKDVLSMYEVTNEIEASEDEYTIDTREKPEREERWSWTLLFTLMALVISPVPIVFALYYYNKKEKNIIKGIKNEE